MLTMILQRTKYDAIGFAITMSVLIVSMAAVVIIGLIQTGKWPWE